MRPTRSSSLSPLSFFLSRFVLFLCRSSFRSLYFCHRLPLHSLPRLSSAFLVPSFSRARLTSERRDGERIGVSVVTPHARVMPSLLVRLRARCPSPVTALPRSPLHAVVRQQRTLCAHRVVPPLPRPYLSRSPTLPTMTRFCVQAASYAIVESFCRVG